MILTTIFRSDHPRDASKNLNSEIFSKISKFKNSSVWYFDGPLALKFGMFGFNQTPLSKTLIEIIILRIFGKNNEKYDLFS